MTDNVPVPIPTNVEPLWNRLNSEVIRVNAFWQTFQDLFLKGPQRAELLVEAGDFFFLLVQEAFLSFIQLALSKLVDPAASRNFENATLERLIVDLDPSPGLRDKLHGHLNAMRTHCEHIRDRRNRELAHFDLSTVVPNAVTANPRPTIPDPHPDEIINALQELFTFMNAIEHDYTGTVTAFRLSTMRLSVTQLLATMKQGLRYNQLVTEQRISFDDLTNLPYHSA